MPHPSLQRILKKSGVSNLIEVLTEKLTPTDLQSLLLDVYQKQAAKITPAQLKEQYGSNRFVQASLIDPLNLLAFDQLAFSIAKKLGFQGIELSPLSPLGSCSAIAKVNQNKVVATSRNIEVIADPTNILALEGALKREQLLKTNAKDTTTVNLCASERVTRAQFMDLPNYFAHFKLFALASAGRDQGNFLFEKEQLTKHLTFYLELMTTTDSILHFPTVEVLVTPIETRLAPFVTDGLFPKLKSQFPTITFKIDTGRKKGISYYQNLCFNINAANEAGDMLNLSDGGFTNWTQQLMSNQKERYLISAIGTERAISLFQRNKA